MDVNPYEPPSAIPDETIKHRSLFIFIFVDLWKPFLKSRNAILCDLYLQGDVASGVRVAPIDDASEARNWWLENQQYGSAPTPAALDKLEKNIVIVSRLVALWMLVWTNLFPVVFAGWWLMSWINSAAAPGILFVVRSLVCVIPIYIVSVIVSFYLQAVFALPFIKLVNWLFPTRLDLLIQPIPDSKV